MQSLVPDKDLVEAARQGNRSAFGELFSRHRESVYRYSMSLLGDPDRAEDAVQETFLRMYDNLESLKDGALLRFWLLGIARNHILNAGRRKSLFLGDATDTPSAEPDPFERASVSDELKLIEAAMNRLPPDMRESLLLKVVEEMSYREIADLTGSTVDVVRTRIYRARQKILLHLNTLEERMP
ncbi:MAG TPA: RNA polymerase sigma factor [Bacteroidota bacterium]|nr:RNA polymerase sigma factor [Bacteroidota bacterium]